MEAARDRRQLLSLAEMPMNILWIHYLYPWCHDRTQPEEDMGDELVSSPVCSKGSLDEYSVQPVTSEQFRDHLSRVR